ncbi:MAG: IPT/TIG domain-containing protein [candidate division KSB1 bacterium]|nr:IPT/TIG domain-containing protein [candidate division KSB1 bacterium]
MTCNVRAQIIVMCLLIAIGGCTKEQPQGLYDPDAEFNPDPVITSLIPPDSALAGLVTVTIKGRHFSPLPANNFVYFGKTRVPVIQASGETLLVVRAPNTPADSIPVKVAVLGALGFSNVVRYRLVQGVLSWGGYGEFDDPYLVECDRQENVYVALGNRNVEKISPTGAKELYGTLPFALPSGMKWGPDGYLYVARKATSLYRIPPAGGAAARWINAPGRIYDFDFAPDGSLYAGGKADVLYRITADGTCVPVADYPNATIRAVRIFSGHVYVGGRDENVSEEFVWRHAIQPDGSLGSREVYFDWTLNVGRDSEVLCLTFAADGDLYIGTNAPQAILVVHKDRSFEPLYPGVLEPTTLYFSWGNGPYLYLCRTSTDPKKKGVFRVHMLKAGAPYYGRP